MSLLFSSWFLGREGKEAAESEGKRKRNASGRHGVLEKKVKLALAPGKGEPSLLAEEGRSRSSRAVFLILKHAYFHPLRPEQVEKRGRGLNASRYRVSPSSLLI